jgi:enoyl-CoA hydratase/carnithine racemase
MMKYEQLKYEKANNIATITLNRPEVLNSITLKMVAELTDAVTTADKDEDVRAIIITGAGRGFCAGDDIGSVFGDRKSVV